MEENCVRDGIRDPLVFWSVPNGDDILIDGHNRWEISAKHGGIPFEMKRMEFDLRDDVKAWIIQNQFGRRNLSAYDRSVLALKLKPLIAEKAKKQQGTRTDISQKSVKSHDTQKELATVAGVSHDTIHKVEKIEEKATPEQKRQVRSGEKSINRVYNEVMNKEIKRPPSAKEYAEQAKERHEDFKRQPVVSVPEVRQEQRDKSTIEQETIRRIKKTLGAITDLYILIDSGEVPVDVLSNDGKRIAIKTLTEMQARIDDIGKIIRKR